jgi:hypothetical protein
MKRLHAVLGICALIAGLICAANAEPIIGSGANTLSRNGIALEAHFGYTSYTARYYIPGEEWLAFGEGESNTEMLFLPQLRYGPFDFLSLRLSIPLIMHKIVNGTEESSTGVGDVCFDFKHLLYRGGKGLPQVSWRAGARFPTGDKDADIPLGDGSMDFMGELLVTEDLPWLSAHANIGYWYNGEVEGVDIDDQIFYTGAVEYPFGFQSSLVAELNGFVSGSGENQFYLLEVCPGITNRTIEKLVIEASVRIPLTARGGLRYDFSPFVGFMYLFR